MKAQSKRNQIINFLESKGAKIVSVVFEKKDGSDRTMLVNRRYAKGLVDSYKSESTKQAVETRKTNNPNLISVMDMQLRRKGAPDKACWRSINLDTVKRVKCGKDVLEFTS